MAGATIRIEFDDSELREALDLLAEANEDWMPALVPEGLGIDDEFVADLAAPERPAVQDAQNDVAHPIFGPAAAGLAAASRIGGEIRVVFDRAPPGMRIESARPDHPDVDFDVTVGYAMGGA